MPDDLLDSADKPDLPDISTLLAAAVSGVGGAERPGQVKMAEAVAHGIDSGEHLAVQAGTGTGKSLAYLVPAVRHAVAENACVVVSTATIALQRQLIDRDLPRLAESLKPLLGREPVFAILKGRRNYLCLHRLQSGAPEDPDDLLFDPQAVSAAGRQVQRIHEWAESTETGDRDELVPGVGEQAWRQVAVSAKECLGAQRCPYGTECFAERARDEAGDADVVVTNHALLAIDALEEFNVLPEHDVVIIDEAHELVDRVTSVATAELSASAVEIAARRCGRLIEDDLADRLKEAGEALQPMLADTRAGRMDVLPQALGVSLVAIRDAAYSCATALRATLKATEDDAERLGAGRAALTSLEEIHDTAVRFLESFEDDIASRHDVVWLDKPFTEDSRRPTALRVAPLGVGGLLRERLFQRRTTVLTSATLSLGGSFEPLARQWGLPPLDAAAKAADNAASANDADSTNDDKAAKDAANAKGGESKEKPLTWSGLDVGSPFDHARSGILYIARGLPSPGRDGLPEAYLTELSELIAAAGGRTLGLFSSMRAAKQAAEALRSRIEQPLLCQGDDTTSQLVKQFAEDDATCLFGTLSLWQGVDVPGPSLRLVVIDRIPFPRPDDPLSSARQRAIAAGGGNGFMAVAATNAALLLAQGAGRLLRGMTDRGVVAILDPRLATARYGSFLRASLPPFWTTYDAETAKGALRRLDAAG
ncbi:MAG: putative ATP-dependent helicase dinG-like protein [Actinoallomurus sp.]|nr:putative ATP-dependent helicase dinG-like protein [Actinoallomurus sp.]